MQLRWKNERVLQTLRRGVDGSFWLNTGSELIAYGMILMMEYTGFYLERIFLAFRIIFRLFQTLECPEKKVQGEKKVKIFGLCDKMNR